MRTIHSNALKQDLYIYFFSQINPTKGEVVMKTSILTLLLVVLSTTLTFAQTSGPINRGQSPSNNTAVDSLRIVLEYLNTRGVSATDLLNATTQDKAIVRGEVVAEEVPSATLAVERRFPAVSWDVYGESETAGVFFLGSTSGSLDPLDRIERFDIPTELIGQNVNFRFVGRNCGMAGVPVELQKNVHPYKTVPLELRKEPQASYCQ